MTNFMNIMQTELKNMLLVLQKCMHAFWQIFTQNLYHLFYFENKYLKTFSWNKFCSAASNFTQTLQGWGWGWGGIEKIEKECWSGLVDCLSLLQICYFYINNPLVMKAILFCDEPFFRYIHEEGGKLLQWAQRPSFPG